MDGSSRDGVKQGRQIRLEIQYFDGGSNFADPPLFPSVTILNPQNVTILSADKTSGVTRQDTGLYYFDYIVPATAPLGLWHDMWSVNVNNTTLSNTFAFNVVLPDTPVTAQAGQEIDPMLSKCAVKNVLDLMKLLRARLGSDGIRRKRDQFGRYILDANGNYVTEPCNVFSTDELYTFLKAALAEFNSIPHFTGFDFDDTIFINTFKHELTEGAYILGITKQMLLEKGREFQFTDDGLSYQPPAVSEILKGQLSDYLANYRERLKFIKRSMPPQPLGIGSVYSFASGGVSPGVIRLRHLRSRQII